MARTTQIVAVLLLVAACAFGHGIDEEVEEIATLLELKPGMQIADVGAGNGKFGIALADRLGEGGHVFIQEIDEDELKKIRRRVRRSGLDNIEIVEGAIDDTKLPDDCCDAILLRFVYHHMTEREAMLDSLRRSVREGGLLLVIERGELGGHGIRMDDVIEEWTAAGYDVVSRQTGWGEHDDHSAVVFRP